MDQGKITMGNADIGKQTQKTKRTKSRNENGQIIQANVTKRKEKRNKMCKNKIQNVIVPK